MRQGYDGDAVQKTWDKVGDYSDNLYLISIAQSDGGDSERAMRATERLIEINQGLVRKIVSRFSDRGVEIEDLMQIGTIGMIKAIRSFDISRGNCFSTYAVPLIFGEIRRYMRDEGPIKVGRQYKRLGALIMKHRNRILMEEGREPHLSELAELCEVSAEEIAIAIDATMPPASLSDSAYGDEEGVELQDVIADEGSLGEAERIIDRIALSDAIASMPPLWQKIVALRFYRGLTQSRTAELCGVTQVKISREEKKLIEQLRVQLIR